MSEIEDALSGKGSEIDAALGGPAKKETGIISRTLRDTGVSLAKGVVDTGQTLYGATNMASGGAIDRASGSISELASRAANVVGDTLTGGNVGAEYGTVNEPLSKGFDQAGNALAEHYSPETAAAFEKVNKTEGFVPTLIEAVKNPSVIYNSAVESAPVMAGMVGTIRATAMAAGERAAAAAARTGASAAEQDAARAAAVTRYSTGAPGVATQAGVDFITSGAQQAQQARTDVLGMDEQTLQTSPTYKALIASGMSPENARVELADRAERVAFGVAGTLSAAASPIGANVEGRAATAGLRREATERVLGIPLPKGPLGKLAASTGQEFVQEGLQSAGEQIGTNVGEQEASPKVDTFNQVGNQAAMGAVTGAAMGGGMHVAGEIGEHAPGTIDHRVDLPGDRPEIQASAGPISAAARTAIDTGAAAIEQTKQVSAAAEENQQRAAKGEFGPEQEAAALAAIERQRDDDVKAMRDFTTQEQPPAPSEAPDSEITHRLNVAAQAQREEEVPRQLFPFRTQEAAEKRAAQMARDTGEEHAVVPHPQFGDRFTALPASELTKPATASEESNVPADLEARAHEAATSPLNQRPEPTPGQKIAGNYKKAPLRIHGMQISIENPVGSVRSSLPGATEQWETVMQHHYGYIRGTVGNDKDHVDAYIGPKPQATRAFVVDQIHPKTGNFDEHKIMLGFASQEAAVEAYNSGFSDGTGASRMGAITPMPIGELKKWVFNKENTSKALTYKAPEVAKFEKPTAEVTHIAKAAGDAAFDSEEQVRKLLIKHPNGHAEYDAIVKAAKAAEDAVHEANPTQATVDGGLAGARARKAVFDEALKGLPEKVAEASRAHTAQVIERADEEEARIADQEARSDGGPVAANEPGKPERRNNAEQRKSVEQMSHEEMRAALLTDDLTGLGNGRALSEDLHEYPHVVAFDADSLKWVNDNLGHESGDELLKAWGRAITQATERGYRKGGDEFFALARSPEEAQTIASKVEDLLSQAVITAETPAGERITITGVGASYGIGQDLKTADNALVASKGERERAGKRAGRGEQPPGVARGSAVRVENPVGEAAGGEVGEPGPVEHGEPGDVQPPADHVEQPVVAHETEPDAARDLERGQAGSREEGGSGEFSLTAPQQLRAGAQEGGGPRSRESAPGRARGPRNGGASAQVPLLDVAHNFRVTNELDFRGVGAKSKFKNNVAAIELLKRLETENRRATPEEQSVLARYVGWGGIPQAFDEKKKDWTNEFARLRELLTPDEYAAARRSTQDAHYTAQPVVNAMWGALARMGFNQGAVLEPSMGTGNFFGLMPPGVRARLTGVELDHITGRIAQHLYPDANVQVTGFNEIRIAPESFDLAIGNPPFGNQSVHDRQYPDLSKWSIHNYFFGKSVESLRPGGLLAMVVSSSFMDQGSQTTRAWIAQRARLLGAVRLPNNAFMANAGTEVTTDVVFLQKLAPGERGNPGDWVAIGTTPDPDGGEPIPLNNYFKSNPVMLLGDMKRAVTMYGPGQPALIARAGVDLGEAMAGALARLPQKIYEPVSRDTKPLEAKAAADLAVPAELRPYSHFLAGDRVMIKTPSLNGVDQATQIQLDGRSLERMKGMVGIRDAVRALLAAESKESTGDGQLRMLRGRLNTLYDAFVKEHGYINSDVNRRVFRDDADYSLLISLEKNYDKGVSAEQARKHDLTARKPTAGKADIFDKRVLFPVREITEASSAKEAMLASLNERGAVDLDYMESIYHKGPAAMLSELGDLVYRDPDGHYAPRDEYLSGNVKAKLAAARDAASKDAAFVRNVTALEAVQPKDIPASDIFVRIGSSWVSAADYAKFAAETFDGKLEGDFVNAVGKWSVRVRSDNDALAKNKWGTPRMPAGAIMEAMLANHQVAVYDVVRDGDKERRVLNAPDTAAAQGKADELAEAFQDWIWKEPERRVRLGRLYNDRFNTNVDRVFDGSHLTFPGMSRAIELRPHQVNMVYRGLQDGTMLADHVVGAGKTFGLAAIAVEGRRIGMHKKPMVAVPNHLVEQWAKDIKRLYPGANVLAASRKDFEKDRRKALFAKIATGDWDAVVVAHKSFGFIPMPPEAERSILSEQMADLEEAIQQSRERDGKKNLSVKQLEKLRDRIKEKIEALADRKQDDLLNFDELGVDALMVDEAQEFKNLFFTTTMQNVAGLGNPEGSIRAFDMFVKTRHILQKTDGRGVYFATGTPVSNSIAETFHMQRYLQMDELKARGIHNFDAWASTFGQAVSDWEMDAAGRYKQKTRFSKFANLGELRTLWRSVADIVTRRDLIEDAKKQGKVFPLPKIKGGKPLNVVVERSPEQAAYIGIPRQKLDRDGKPEFDAETGQPVMEFAPGTIVYRLENWKDAVKRDPREMPLVITGDARKAGLDFRLINDRAPDFPGSKVNDAARRIHDIWQKNDYRKGTQLVFIDLSTPKAHKGKATEAAAARVPTYFVRQPAGDLRHVAGVKTKLAAAPDVDFFSVKDGTRYAVHVMQTGALLAYGRTKQEAVDGANAAIGDMGREALDKSIRDRAIPQPEIDAYIQRFEEEKALQEDSAAAEDDKPVEQEISLDDLLADQGGDFSVYDDLREKLVGKGVPREQIAFIHDYDSDIAKSKLFDAVNNGEIRVLLGSTKKMGAGTNVQRKLVAEHNLDAPWKPSDLEQREGRIIRQGNEFYEADPDGFEIELYRYATRQTYDSRMWEIIERKAAAIEAFKDANGARELEDVSSESANAAEMKAGASGNPKILEEIQLRQELRKLEAQQKAFNRGRYDLQDMVRAAKDQRGYPYDALQSARDAQKVVAAKPTEDAPLGLRVVSHAYESRKDLPIATIAAEIVKVAGDSRDPVKIGSYRGLDLVADLHRMGTNWNLTLRMVYDGHWVGTTNFMNDDKWSATGFLARLDNMADKIPERITRLEGEVAQREKQAKDAAAELLKDFPRAGELAKVREQHKAVLADLRSSGKRDRDVQAEAAEKRGPAKGPGSTPDQVREWLAQPLSRVKIPVAIAADVAEARALTGITDLEPDTAGLAYKGRIILVTSKLGTRLDAEKAFYHEAFHVGLRRAFGKDAEGYARALREIAGMNANIKDAAAKWRKSFGKDAFDRFQRAGMSNAEAFDATNILSIEEALAGVSATRGANVEVKGLRALVLALQKMLRAVGLHEMANWLEARSDAEALSFIAQYRGDVAASDDLQVLTQQTAPAFLRSLTEEAPQMRLDSAASLERIRDEAAALWETPRTFNILHRTVGTQQHKAAVDADFGRVFRLGQNYLQDVATLANDPADLAPHVLPMIRDLKDALRFAKVSSKEDLEKVSGAVFQGTLEDHVFTDEELRARFQLTDPQITQYRETRQAIDRSLDQLATSEGARLVRKEGLGHVIEAAMNTPENGTQIIANGLEAQAQAMVRLGDERGAANKRSLAQDVLAKGAKIRELKEKGYAPLMRFGQYTVHVTQEGEQLFFGMYESKRAANRAAEAMRTEFPGANVQRGVLSKEAYRLFQGLTPDTIELFGDMVTVGPDGQKVKLGETELFQQYLKLAVNNRSAVKRLIQRKGIAGFSEDVSRVLAQFLTSNARAASGNLHFADMLDAVNAVPKEKGDVKDEAVKLMRYLQDPQEEAAGLRGFLFVNYLGGSIASALTNMTQPILMSFPYLAQWGTRRAASALAEGSMLAATRAKITDPELAAAVAKAVSDGVIAPQEIHQLQAEAMRGLGANLHLRKGLALWGSLFSLAEQFNRKATFIAAYRIAKAEGMPNPFTFAEDAVKETQGIYNRGNRPNWARGAIGATLFTFKQFSIAYIEFLKRLPPKQQALALAILVLAAGAQGLPFADDIDDAIDTIAQALGYSWNTKQEKQRWLAGVLGDGLSDFVLHGASTLPGVPLDVQGRLGLGNLIPGSAIFKRSETDKSRDLLEAAGPIGSAAQSLTQGLAALEHGNFGEALGKAAPTAIQNAIKGIEMSQMGMYRDQKGRKVMDTDAWDAFIKTVGFQPSNVAAESRRMQEAQQNIALAREVEGSIADKWAQGVFEKDIGKVREATDELRQWNITNPGAPIGIKPAQIQQRVRQMAQTREQRTVKSAPREIRAEVIQELHH